MSTGDAAGTDGELCRCRHARALHRHYRAGTDCAICGPEICRRYRPAASRWGRLLGLIRSR